MAKKNHHYVLVMSSEGPVFVTGILPNHYAEYNKLEKPLDFKSQSYAKEVAFGLSCNFILAYPITVPYEINGQLYRYNEGHFEWKDAREENKDE